MTFSNSLTQLLATSKLDSAALENIIYLKEALGLSHSKVRETLTVAIKSLFDS